MPDNVPILGEEGEFMLNKNAAQQSYPLPQLLNAMYPRKMKKGGNVEGKWNLANPIIAALLGNEAGNFGKMLEQTPKRMQGGGDIRQIGSSPDPLQEYQDWLAHTGGVGTGASSGGIATGAYGQDIRQTGGGGQVPTASGQIGTSSAPINVGAEVDRIARETGVQVVPGDTGRQLANANANMMSTMNPMQEHLFNQMGGKLSSLIESGPAAYGGDFAAALSAPETQALGGMSDFMAQMMAPGSFMSQILSGEKAAGPEGKAPTVQFGKSKVEKKQHGGPVGRSRTPSSSRWNRPAASQGTFTQSRERTPAQPAPLGPVGGIGMSGGMGAAPAAPTGGGAMPTMPVNPSPVGQTMPVSPPSMGGETSQPTPMPSSPSTPMPVSPPTVGGTIGQPIGGGGMETMPMPAPQPIGVPGMGGQVGQPIGGGAMPTPMPQPIEAPSVSAPVAQPMVGALGASAGTPTIPPRPSTGMRGRRAPMGGGSRMGGWMGRSRNPMGMMFGGPILHMGVGGRVNTGQQTDRRRTNVTQDDRTQGAVPPPVAQPQPAAVMPTLPISSGEAGRAAGLPTGEDMRAALSPALSPDGAVAPQPTAMPRPGPDRPMPILPVDPGPTQPPVDPNAGAPVDMSAGVEIPSIYDNWQQSDLAGGGYMDEVSFDPIREQRMQELQDTMDQVSGRFMGLGGASTGAHGDALGEASSRLLTGLGAEEARFNLGQGEAMRQAMLAQSGLNLQGAQGEQTGALGAGNLAMRGREADIGAYGAETGRIGTTLQGMNIPMQGYNQLMGMGGVERDINQRDLDMQYQDWMRQNPNWQQMWGAAGDYTGEQTQAWQQPTQEQPSGWQNFWGGMGGGIGTGIGAYLGGR